MERTIKINLGGMLFLVDEEAYLILRDYLKSIESKFLNLPDGSETFQDIEMRIAEIFQSRKNVGVITKQDVEYAISIIGKPDDLDLPDNDRYSYSSQKKRTRGSSESGIGNAFNELLRAVGRVLFIFFRVILIVLGISLVLACALTLLSFIMVFVFKYPGSFSTSIDNMDLSYIPDFLNFIVTPQVALWITILSAMVVVLPLLAIIYWGVRMIFWLRVNDGIFNLAAFVIWIMSIAALSIILLNEGVNYAEASEITINVNPAKSYDTLYISPGKRIADLEYDYKVSIPDEHYDVFLNEGTKEVFIRTYLSIEPSDDKNINIEILKRSNGRNRHIAGQRTETLIYNFRDNGNTIFLDEYFGYPSGMRWAFDNVRGRLSIPAGTIVGIDINAENFIHPRIKRYGENGNTDDHAKRFWKMTEEGLKPLI